MVARLGFVVWVAHLLETWIVSAILQRETNLVSLWTKILIGRLIRIIFRVVEEVVLAFFHETIGDD